MLTLSHGKSSLNQHVLAVLEKCNHINHLKQLQAFLITLGHGQTQFFTIKLVRFYTLALTKLEYACFIFDHLNFPNVYLYTAMVTAYESHSDQRSFLLLFHDMVHQGRPRPNHFTYAPLRRSCPEFLESCGTELVHTQIMKSGFERYPVVQTSLLDSYLRFCSDLEITRWWFNEMSERNVVSWTAMISGCARLGKMCNGLLLFDEMPERDIPSWSAVIAGCTQNGQFLEAISLFRRMVVLAEEGPHQDNWPNQITVVCALSTCGHTGMLQLGRCTHGYIYRNGLGSDSFISNALVDMYGKCGSLREARRVFDKTSKRSLMPWNSMINCFSLC